MATKNNSPKGYALITGGTSGIGYELAKCFAQDGYNLIIVARSEDGLQKVSDELRQQYNIEVQTISKDLMVPGAAKEVYQQTQSTGLAVEVLVNDAGQGYWGKFAETDLDREIDLVHLNVIALISLTKFYIKDMIARGSGKILQLASSLAKAPSPYMSVYAASKAFVLSFNEALTQELKGTGVTVTALQPGATDTDFFHKAEAEETVEYREASLYDPAEVAKAGYEALMAGTDKVSPGFKNKMQGAMGTVLPDAAVAANMKQHLKQSTKEDGREEITHQRSAEERARINQQSGKTDGDIDQHEDHLHEEKGRQ
jgi:short-subunit dehydrogenase